VLDTILATKEAVKHFAPNGDSAINMSSIASAGVPGVAICSGSKSSVDAITRGLVAELGPRKSESTPPAGGVSRIIDHILSLAKRERICLEGRVEDFDGASLHHAVTGER
jgi:hypothetical protein